MLSLGDYTCADELSLPHVLELFSDRELGLLADEIYVDEADPQLFWLEVSDAIRLRCLDRQWGVVGPALVCKLRRLRAPETAALIRLALAF
jgi:hypothetical protein